MTDAEIKALREKYDDDTGEGNVSPCDMIDDIHKLLEEIEAAPNTAWNAAIDAAIDTARAHGDPDALLPLITKAAARALEPVHGDRRWRNRADAESVLQRLLNAHVGEATQ